MITVAMTTRAIATAMTMMTRTTTTKSTLTTKPTMGWRRGCPSGAAPFSPSSRALSSLPSCPITLDGADWFDEETGTYKYFTGNEFKVSSSASAAAGEEDGRHVVMNPGNNEVLGAVPEISSDEFEDVVRRSAVAQKLWRAVPVQQRQRLMNDFLYLLNQHTDELAGYIALENGKTLPDARGDVFRGVEVVETACNVATHLLGDSLSNMASYHRDGDGYGYDAMDCVSYRRPLGVTAGICPFNFPAMIPLWMFPLSIACGNSCVMKPSEKTPSAMMHMCKLMREAGLPPDVLQVVHGGIPVVERLCRHPDIKAVSFVGGGTAGERVYRLGTGSGKRVQSNLGAKNHAVVMPDSISTGDDDTNRRSSVIRSLVGAGFGAAGQRCMALSVVVMVGSREESIEFVREVAEEAQKLRVGPGWSPTSDIGPLITADSKRRVVDIVTESVQRRGGADLLLDGRDVVIDGIPAGQQHNYVGPTILSGVTTENPAYTEEIFGPVLSFVYVDALDDAIRLINGNPYGNGCCVYTSDGSSAKKFVSSVEVGQVGINVPIPVPLPMFSFTGNKASLLGDVNFYGKSGVQFYTQIQTVTSNWITDTPSSSSSSSSAGGGGGAVNMPTVGKKE